MNNKIALITWASSGLGKEFAKIHASKSWDVIVVARRGDKLLELKKELESEYKINVTIIEKDLTEKNAWEYIYNQVKDLWLEVDYLINNAGFWDLWDFIDGDMSLYSNMIQLNITALTELTSFYLKDFVQKDSGKILNISSTAALVPGPGHAVYFATKAYVSSFSEALTAELADTNVSVTSLLPWATKTEFWSTSGMDKTDLFSKAASSYSVALDGYNAMLESKINILSGVDFKNSILLKIAQFLPKKIVLKLAYDSQKINK